MKLIGYIKPYKDFSSSIPIYFDGIDYYYHSLDNKFIISNFIKAEFDLSYLIRIGKKSVYKKGNIGALIFIADKNKVFIGNAKTTILDVCNYFDKQDFTKKYMQEEIFFYAKQLGIITEYFEIKFQLKNLVQNNNSIIKPNIINLINLIETYTKDYKIKRNRKSSFKHQKKSKVLFGNKICNYDNSKIETYKNYFINNIKTKDYRKAYHELENLINYQIKVSTSSHLVKSLCAISTDAIENGFSITAKILLFLSKLFNVIDPVVDTQLAEILKIEGNIIESKKLYLKIQKQFPENRIVRCGFAEILKDEGDLQKAKQLYLQVQKDFPDDIVSRTGYAEILKAEGKTEEAKNYYLKILKDFPNDLVANSGFAEILKTQGNLKEARKLYLKIQKQFPNDIYAKTGYAEILKLEGNLLDAKSLFLNIIKEFPENIVAKTGYAEILKYEGKFENAKEIYINIQNQFPFDKVSRTSYAEILKSEGNITDAKLYYLDIQKQFPYDVYSKTGYAELLKEEGNFEEAEKLYIKIQKLHPENIVAQNGFADLLKSEGKYKEAIILLKGIINRNPENLYAKHSILNIHLLTDSIKKIDDSIFIKSNPKTINDYYFYHSFIVFTIKNGEFKKAEKLITIEIEKIPFYKTKLLFEQTLIYVKILQTKFEQLLNELNMSEFSKKSSPIELIFKTHIYAENNLKDEAIENLNILKLLPKSSIFYSNATLLSEIYSLNGLPKKGLPKNELNKMLLDQELQALNIMP